MIDSFLGGLGAYFFIPETRDCVRFQLEHVVEIDSTLQAWNFTNPDQELIYSYSAFDVTVYNGTQYISQYVSYMFGFCTRASFDGILSFYGKQLQFETESVYLLSFFQNFLSKVVYISLYYERWLKALTVNNVNVMTYYGAKIIELLLNFDRIDLDEVNNPTLNWNGTYEYYVPPNYSKYQAPNPVTFDPNNRIVMAAHLVEDSDSEEEEKILSDESMTLAASWKREPKERRHKTNNESLLIKPEAVILSQRFIGSQNESDIFLVRENYQVRKHPLVQDHLAEYRWFMYIEITSNFAIGFIDASLTLDQFSVKNCSYYIMESISIIMETDNHVY